MTGRVALDLCPPDTDRFAWAEHRAEFHRAESLETLPYPVQLDLELNGGCNMACPFCPHGYEDVPNRQMPRETAERLIREAVALGTRSLKLNYINEPLLRFDLVELIECARAEGMLNVYFVTNGTLLKPHRRRALLHSGLTKLFVSIDAVTAETYDAQRLGGCFQSVVGNVEAFIRERDALGNTHPLVVVSFLVNGLNAHERAAFEQRWVGLADVVSYQPTNEVPGRKTGLPLMPSRPISGCKFPFKQIVVNHRGVIMPCCKLAGRVLAIGNVWAITLAEAWERMAPLRAVHAEGRWLEHRVCADCLRCR
jgi:radical SAM protein with 4Fe4S-binding SPASM domain